MKEEETLKKAIEKAIDNGFIIGSHDFTISNTRSKTCKIYARRYIDNLETLIFNHAFARAFWGKREFLYASNGV